LFFLFFGQIVFGTSALYTLIKQELDLIQTMLGWRATINLFVVFAVALDHFGAEVFNLNNTMTQL
jgi:hypothetical protein